MTSSDTDDLEARVRRLEAAVFPKASDATLTAPSTTEGAAVAADEPFWALRGLEQRTADLDHGAVLFTGSVRTAAGPVQWQYARTTDDLLELAATGAEDSHLTTTAARFAAIGSPVRLHLLLAVANGTTALTDLAALDGIGTTGQVYHHVRVLTTAGWLQAAGRGRVTIPSTRVVPLLAAIAAME
ncbi:winged helix-turn-helix domain-containing protein [Plantibacter flavus]|uniref:ArsR family transcriptional regulator n=1 Tax=Plantibacter flavus TaxID=150123 RepID=UPI003F1438AB